ncbi:MAG: tetratricopeptide repeat protein [Sedimentisphaerales bacterium]|nr:tetratricopeptide repeat protein [Sedimentisphaerales bacterium]
MEKRGKAIRILAVALGLCAATAFFFSLKLLLNKASGPQVPRVPAGTPYGGTARAEEEESSRPTEGLSSSSTEESGHVEEGIAAVKNEEFRVVEKLIRDFPGNENPLIIMGEMFRSRGDAVEATKYYERALKINPRRPEAHVALSEFCIKEANFAEAITHWRKVLEVQPQAQLMNGYIGEALLMLNKPAEAIEALEKEVQVTPYSSRSYCLIGQAYQQLEEYDKARENYEASVKINPENSDAYYGLMTVCTKLGDRDKAKEYSESFRRVKAEAREELKADKVKYDDIFETQKRSALTYVRAAQIYRLNGNVQTAEELLNQAARLDPENVACLLELASLYRKNGQQTKALEIHAKIRGMAIEDLIDLLEFGALSVDLQQFEDAEKAFRKAIELAPQSPSGYQKLALLYLTIKKELAEAKGLAEKAVALEETAINYSLLSRACIMNGDGAGALEAIRKALELEPQNREYQRYYDLIRRMN